MRLLEQDVSGIPIFGYLKQGVTQLELFATQPICVLGSEQLRQNSSKITYQRKTFNLKNL